MSRTAKPTDTRPEWLSLQQAADYLGASIDTLRRRIADGQLPAFYVGRSRMLRIKASDLDALMKPVRTLAYAGRAR